jgi:hypothetical protein
LSSARDAISIEPRPRGKANDPIPPRPPWTCTAADAAVGSRHRRDRARQSVRGWLAQPAGRHSGGGDDTAVDVSLPIHLWFQLGQATFAGPLFGAVWQNDAEPRLPLGLGLGISVSDRTELRSWLLFRDIAAEEREDVGAGIAFSLRL